MDATQEVFYLRRVALELRRVCVRDLFRTHEKVGRPESAHNSVLHAPEPRGQSAWMRSMWIRRSPLTLQWSSRIRRHPEEPARLLGRRGTSPWSRMPAICFWGQVCSGACVSGAVVLAHVLLAPENR